MQLLGRWLYRCEIALLYVGVIATFAMMCLTSADALSRYTFNRPILGAFEITEKYLMVAAIFMGLSYGYRGGLFIRVTFLVDRLPRAHHPDACRPAARAQASVIAVHPRGARRLLKLAVGERYFMVVALP